MHYVMCKSGGLSHGYIATVPRRLRIVFTHEIVNISSNHVDLMHEKFTHGAYSDHFGGRYAESSAAEGLKHPNVCYRYRPDEVKSAPLLLPRNA